MKSIPKSGYKLFHVLIAALVVSGLLFSPSSLVFAQDEVPPAETETGESAPPEEEAPPPEEEGEAEETVELPPEATVEPPDGTEPTEEPSTGEGLVEVTVEAPAAGGDEASPEGESDEESATEETISEIVDVLAETNTILVDENGEEIPLASEEAEEVLVGVDPYFWDGDTNKYYGFSSSGNCPYFVDVCTTTSTPLTDALGDSRLDNGATVYIEGTTSGAPRFYNETVTIDNNVNLRGVEMYYSGGKWRVDESEGRANIATVNLLSEIGTITRVTADNIFVIPSAGASNNSRGNMLTDALNLVATNGLIDLAAGTYTDNNDDFDIDTDGVTLQGAGATTIIDGHNDGNGIDINADNVTVRYLKVIGCADGVGIKVDGDDATLNDVISMGNNYGVRLGGDSDDTTMTDLVLMNNNFGLYADNGSDDASIHDSIIAGNTVYGVFNLSNHTIDATGNYWGHASGPTSCWKNEWGNPSCGTAYGDKVYSNTTFSYWWYGWHTNYLNVLTGAFLTAPCDDGDPATNDVLNPDGTCSHTPAQADCPPGENDIDMDGDCESSGCANGFTDADNDGDCESSGCANGFTDTDHDGTCESSGCANGFTDTDNDGTCESSGCANGFTDTDHDGACESSGCANGFTDTNNDGACESSGCANGFTDTDHDGVCESSGCVPGFSDIDHDGDCEATICPETYFDAHSDGTCVLMSSDVPDDGDGAPIIPLGPFGGGAGGAGAVIPVTGGLMVDLSCVDANTLMLPNGDSVTFSTPLCEYQAALSEEAGTALPGPLPDGLTFVSGMTLTVQDVSGGVGTLPPPTTQTLSFLVPEDLAGKEMVILFWDPSAAGGLGGWVEVPSTAPGLATLNYTGTFVLAYR